MDIGHNCRNKIIKLGTAQVWAFLKIKYKLNIN